MVDPFAKPGAPGAARIPTPDAGPRPEQGEMDAAELQTLVDGLVTSAIQYVDQDLSPDRAKATEYYQGKPFGNEETGRSQVVLTEVRDGVTAVIPPMLRSIFNSAEQVVEFRPERADAAAAAEQATDYVNYVFSEDNPGFLSTLAVLKDGLIRKIGVYKWGWDSYGIAKQYKLAGITQEQLETLAADPEIAPTLVTPDEYGTFDVELTRQEQDGKACVYAVPPEEFLFNREARSVEDAIFVAHRCMKSRGELLAMGIAEKDIDEHGSTDTQLRDNEEAIARNPLILGMGTEDEAGEANTKIRYIEAYARLDYDGDGVAELRRICTIGTGNYVVENEPAECAPFAIWCPDPEPHTMLGQSWADRLMDMQRLKSFLMRSSLDSLAAAIHPRKWYKQGDANLADLMNTSIGAPIRTQSGPNAVGEFSHSFVGKEAFPVLQYCDDIVERRTGQNKGAQGLDADALQSSTKAAVTAAVTASQAQQEMLVRIFAEGTLKPLFRGLLKLLVSHQPRARVVRLRGKFVEVDPRAWNADMDVQVNVALGSGLDEEKIATLLEVKATQESILQLLGPQNPIVTMQQYRDTLALIVAMRGFKDASRFFKEVDQAAIDQAAEEAKQQPPPPSPEMMLAQAQIQIEQMKTQAKLAADQAKLEMEQQAARQQAQLDRMEIALKDDRERDKQAAETVLKLRELELKYPGVSLGDQIAEIQTQREQAQSFRQSLRRKKVSVQRDASRRIVGATVEEAED